MVNSHRRTHDDLGNPLLEEGRIVEYDGRIWRIGLVNISRARLDPVTPGAASSPVSGRTFSTYGSPISICSTSKLHDADLEQLDVASLNRLVRMQNDAEAGQSTTANQGHNQQDDDDEGDVANMATPTTAAMPVAVKSQADKNKERIAALAAKKGGATNGAVPGAVKEKKSKVADQECKCGCGGMTASYFVPGHDARFKGWLKKIETGKAKKEDLMKAKVISDYKWVKIAGGGEKPTTNYKGEKL